jgi:hypothetical protein
MEIPPGYSMIFGTFRTWGLHGTLSFNFSVIFSPGILVRYNYHQMGIRWNYRISWNETIVIIVISIFPKPDFLPFENDFPILTTIHGEIQIWSLKFTQELVKWLWYYYDLYWSTNTMEISWRNQCLWDPYFFGCSQHPRYRGGKWLGKEVELLCLFSWNHVQYL